MAKVSTPGDREFLAGELPVLMTELEIMMSVNWNSTVVHIFTFHMLETIIRAGPYVANNILDIERFHTLFKALARCTQVMASIKNHYLLLEASLTARLSLDLSMNWQRLPSRSSIPGHASRLDSEDRSDRLWHPKGTDIPFFCTHTYMRTRTYMCICVPNMVSYTLTKHTVVLLK